MRAITEHEWVVHNISQNEKCDWKLPDDEFVQQFKLPGKSLGKLAAANPFPCEDRVHFDEESHTYTIDR